MPTRILAIVLATGACASDPPRPAPARNADGLPVTGRAPYDVYFRQVRHTEARAKDLTARALSLAGPVAIALELPVSAPTEDLAAALRKAKKRCARLGLRVRIVVNADSPRLSARLEAPGEASLPANLRPGLEAAVAALTAALALRPDLEDATRQGESLLAEGRRLTEKTPAVFSKRGSAYARAVAREVSDAMQRLEDAVKALRQARDFTRALLALLPDEADPAVPGARAPSLAPRLTTR